MIEKKAVPLDEQETTINIYPNPISKTAEIYTCMTTMIVKLKKLAENRPNEVKITKEDAYGLFAEVPAKWVKITPSRILSEEEKQALRDRFATSRQVETQE